MVAVCHFDTYGAVLAVLIPAWMRFICENHKKAFTIFASQVMAVEEGEDTKIQREKGIIAVDANISDR